MLKVNLEEERIVLPTGHFTYDDYLKLPNDGKRYEVIEGILYVANAPNSEHQCVVSELTRQIGNFVMDRELGRVIPAPFEVHLSEISRPLQPDVLFIRKERIPVDRFQFFKGSPDLVIEVTSPSTVRVDKIIKFTAYEQHGVSEYWIVNPHTRTVEVYTLSNQEYALLGEFTGNEVIESAVLEGIGITASNLFG